MNMEEIVNNEPVVESTPVVEETKSVEETVTEAQAPVAAPTAPMTKEEVIERLKAIAENDEEVSRQYLEGLKSSFYKTIKAEGETAYKKYIEDGGDAEAYVPEVDPTEQQFKDVLAVIREKRAAQHEAEEKLKEENYVKKVQIIEKIKAILENPDEVNKSYNDFRQLQTEWNEIKEVPAEKATDLWKNYQVLVEKFYDTLKLNNEFRAYDFKKNLELKTALCEAAERLTEEEDVLSAFHQLQNLHQQYREIGPVARELREEIWNRFKAASTIINKRHQDYFEGRKEEEQENLAQKTAICEILEGYDIESFKTMAQWNETSEQITQLQAKWKTIGFAPQKQNQKIYDRFRAACDKFFTAKAEFFKGIRDAMNENLAKKRELVAKAEALKDSTDWKNTSDALIALQKEWTTIGAVPKKYSEDVWKQFRAACDVFFEAKKKNGNNQYAEQNDNLKKKKSVIARLADIVPEDFEGDLRQHLRDAQSEWDGIGHVPFKDKDKIFKALREQMDRLYGYLGETASKRRVERFKNEVANGGGDKLKERLQRQAELLQQEIKTYENNLGFLNLSKGSKGSSLVEEINRKVEKLKAELQEIKEKIKIAEE